MSTPVLPARDRAGRIYKPAIGSRLRPLLWVILIGFALLAANGFYLSSVTALTWYLGTTQQTFLYMLMVALHLFLGLVLVIPFLIFGFAHLATSWKRPNKWAIRYGLILLGAGLVTLASGFILVRIGGFLTVTDFGGLDVGIPQAMRRSIDFAANSHGIGAG